MSLKAHSISCGLCEGPPPWSVGGTMEFARMENGFYEKLVQSAGMWAHVAWKLFVLA